MTALPNRTLWIIMTAIIVYCICYTWIDLPTAKFCHTLAGSSLANLSISIGHLFKTKHWAELALLSGVIATLIWIFGEKRNARPWLLFAASVVIALAIATLFKFGLARYRPEIYFQQGLYGFHWLSNNPAFNSTPSGHTTAAFAGFISLAMIFKHRIVWLIAICLATLIAISRVLAGAHYPSDLIFGATLGNLSCLWVRHFFYTTKETSA